MRIIFQLIFILLVQASFAQSVAINNNGAPADPSAMLDIKSENKGLLIPRMNSSQRNMISSPAKGLLVFDETTLSVWFYSGSSWLELRGVGSANFWMPHTNGIYYNAAKVGIGTTPHSIYPLYVRQPNSNIGQGIAHFESDDIWHAAISIKNNTTSRQYALVVGGVNNSEVKPNNFGILNTNLIRWSMIVEGSTNFVGFGSPSVNSPVPKSTVHVFTGDVNIEQIGSGIIMKSSNGQCWRVTIDNTGNFVKTAITCP